MTVTVVVALEKIHIHHDQRKRLAFALGASLPLYYYRSIATDRSLIPRNSRVYIPAYQAAAYHGWMCAVDTGGAINGRHIDVYRPAPKEKFGSGYSTPNQPVYVVPPGKRRPKGAPKMSTCWRRLVAKITTMGATHSRASSTSIA